MSTTGIIHIHCEQLSGAAAKGTARISVNTSDQQVRDPVGNIVFSGPLTVTLSNGEATVTVPATDDATLSPTGFEYTVVEQLVHVAKSDYRVATFPVAGGTTVHTADVASSEEVDSDPSYGGSLNGALLEIEAIRDITDEDFADALSASFVGKGTGTLGAELVSNGTFTTNLTGWTGTNWAQNAGTAKHTAGNTAALTQAAMAPVVGTTYFVSFAVTGRTAGSVALYMGGVWIPTTADGTYTGYITATTTDALRFPPDDSGLFDGAIDNVSVKVVTAATAQLDDRVTFTKGFKLFGNIEVADGTPIAIGKDAAKVSGTGTYNVANSVIAIGYNAAKATSTGQATAIGYRAGEANTDGVLTAVGKWAGMANTTGHTTVYGNAAGRSNTTASIDVFGDEAGALNTTGTIAAFGYYAAHNNVTGTITAIGHEAGKNCGTAAQFTAVGHQAGAAATAVGGTFVGHTAGALTTTGRATAVGQEALVNNTTSHSVAVGYQAGLANTTGESTIIGYQSGLANTTGRLTTLGYGAAQSSVSGSIIAIGYLAGTSGNPVVTDDFGIIIGQGAGRDVSVVSALSDFIAIGTNAKVTKSGQAVIGAAGYVETTLYGSVNMAGTNGACIVPRLTTTQKNALTAVNGMVVYDSTLGKFQGREAGAWVNLI